MPRTHRRLIALLTIPLLVLMSGCMRMKADYEILSDSTVQVSMDIGMRNDMLKELGEDVPDFCEQTDTMGAEGLTQEEYVDEGDDGYTGCRLTGTAPINEINDSSTRFVLEDDVWTFHMEGDDSGGTAGVSADMFSDFQIRVTFPGKVLSHNGASTQEGNTVTWADPADLFTEEGLKATAEGSGGGQLWLWIAIGALVLIAAAVTAVLLQRRGKNAPPQGGPWQDGTGQPYPPQGPGPDQPYPPQGPGQPYPGQGPVPGQEYGPGEQYPPQGPGQQFGGPGQTDGTR